MSQIAVTARNDVRLDHLRDHAEVCGVHAVNQRRCGTQRNFDFSTQCGADQRQNPLLTHTPAALSRRWTYSREGLEGMPTSRPVSFGTRLRNV